MIAPKLITKLTSEQEGDLPIFREHRRAIGLRSDRIDDEESRAAIRELYTAANLPVPKAVFVAQSPLQALLMRGVFKLLGDEKLRSQLGSQLESQLGSHLRSQLESQLGSQLWSQLESQLESQNLYDSLWMIGGWDGYWIAFYEFGQKIGVKYSAETERHLQAYLRYANTCGVAYCYKDIALVCDRPNRLMFDNARRLHADDGMALSWTDGYGVYAWHGYRIPLTHTWIITDKARITNDAILAEPNAELRRIMLEITGYETVKAKAHLISEDVDGNGHSRRLMTIRVKDKTHRIVEVHNGSLEPDGSRRSFILGAMVGETPHEVIARSYGINPKHFREACRT